jgi:hypothetical protein
MTNPKKKPFYHGQQTLRLSQNASTFKLCWTVLLLKKGTRTFNCCSSDYSLDNLGKLVVRYDYLMGAK